MASFVEKGKALKLPILSLQHFFDYICGALRNLVPFVQFKKREKRSMGVFHVF